MEAAGGNLDLNDTANSALVDSFYEITSSTRQEAAFFLESHQWDLDAAVSTFLDNDNAAVAVAPSSAVPAAPPTGGGGGGTPSPTDSPDESMSPNYSPSQSPARSRSRSRSLSPAPATMSRLPYQLRQRGEKKNKKTGTAGASGSGNRGGIRTLADLNRIPGGSDSDDDDDEPQEYYTGGEKSGMLVQDPTRRYDADSIFDQARNSGAVQRPEDSSARSSSASRSFTGTGRLLTGETVPTSAQPPESVNHTITLWRNGFTVNDGPLRRLNDPANADFLESVQRSECPRELEPADRRTKVHLALVRRDENYAEPAKKKPAFQGVGRTLGTTGDGGASASESPAAPPLKSAPAPSVGLTVDSSSPTTSIQLRLADGTRMVSRFNLHHTIRDVRAFIVASRPGEAQDFQLQTMGFPPRQLTDPDQTIKDAEIANSVVMQKF
ncbi:unnamed protein product [Linum tenue]|uniref:NSFL1 cofactor p47 n=1 Tax=Linum tenue TaxID=586396 RepID=A0AAV0LB74_9ROSI|nr:unnamed protein product [Linum tenue]